MRLGYNSRVLVLNCFEAELLLYSTLSYSMSFPSAFLPSPPDPASRQPFTVAAFLPLFSLQYVLAVLAILPHTFILRLALLPVLLWQAWKYAVGLDLSVGLANLFGLESPARLSYLNMFGVRQALPFFHSLSTDDCAGRDVRYRVEVSHLDVR